MAKEKLEDLKGRIKEAAGDLTDDERLKWEGKTDRAAASVREKTEDVIDKVKEKSQEAIDRVNEKLKDEEE